MADAHQKLPCGHLLVPRTRLKLINVLMSDFGVFRIKLSPRPETNVSECLPEALPVACVRLSCIFSQ